MNIKMLALTKWRVELYDMYFKRRNLKVLTFLEFTEDVFFFPFHILQKSLVLEKMIAKFLE